jgi:DNA-binding GntR family transcriptional regulator
MLLRISLYPPPANNSIYPKGDKVAKLNVRVNRKRPESMTRQIREQLDSLIEAGELAAGTLLPSERELANTLKVARNVVRGAYEQLMDAGRLRSEGRKGRSVRSGSGGGGKKKAASKSTKTTKARKK